MKCVIVSTELWVQKLWAITYNMQAAAVCIAHHSLPYLLSLYVTERNKTAGITFVS